MPLSDQSRTRGLSDVFVMPDVYKTDQTAIAHRKAEEEPRLIRNIPLTQTAIPGTANSQGKNTWKLEHMHMRA